MNVCKDKTLLIASGIEGVGQKLIQHVLEYGPKEIRVLDNNEERLVAMRDEFMAHSPESAIKVKYYCADMNDSESVDNSMPGVDLVLCVPSLKSVADIESYPADACITLLESTDNVMQSAIEHGVEKVVVITPAYKEPLYNTPNLLAALLEKVVVTQGRYQKKDAKTTICCARMDDDELGLVNHAFTEAKNGDLIVKQNGVFRCVSCYNPGFERDDFTNI